MARHPKHTSLRTQMNNALRRRFDRRAPNDLPFLVYTALSIAVCGWVVWTVGPLITH